MKVQMKYFKNNHLQIPKLGMGTWQLHGYECTDIVSAGLEAGYRLIDTAQAYENEEYVGAAIEQSGVPRQEIFLVTKIGHNNLSHERVVESTRQSLDKLKTDHVDLILIHWPSYDIPLDETLAGMEELLNEGLAKNIGVSNFPVAWLEQTQELSPEFVCNQVEYHPFLSQEPVLKWIKENHKFLMAYSPLARGEVFKHQHITKIADKHGVDEAQIALAWLLKQEAVVAIPKASSLEHLRNNLDSLVVNLDQEDMQNLNNLQVLNKRMIDPDFAPDWDLPHRPVRYARRPHQVRI